MIRQFTCLCTGSILWLGNIGVEEGTFEVEIKENMG